MQMGRTTNASGYEVIARQLADRALSIATDSSPHRAKEGEMRWPMANALPAARILIDAGNPDDKSLLADSASSLTQTLAEPTGKVTDGFGHHRPVYVLFAVHLLASAARLVGQSDAAEPMRVAAESAINSFGGDDAEPRLAVWRRLIARQHGIQEAEQLPISSDQPAPLVPLGRDDLIDSWTYHELLGLQGLHTSGLLESDTAFIKCAESAALYHLGHTQPDYTTYQPWGLAAFASNPQTAVFAEQQLHDVATHLSIEGPGGAVLPALLLAEASATMSGRLLKAWSRD